MNLSELYPAMRWKIKLNCEDAAEQFAKNILVRIEPTQDRQTFLVNAYGEGASGDVPVLCRASGQTADHLFDLFEGEYHNVHKCMFLVDGVGQDNLVVQTYAFQSVTEYKSAIIIIVSDQLLEKKKTTIEKLRQEFVWNQLGMPALFSLNYKNRKKQKDNVRFIGGKRVLVAQNSARGIFADGIDYLRDKDGIPVDLYVASEIQFVAQSDQALINDDFSKALKNISHPDSYFKRWEAYNALSEKLLDAESREFGELKYSSHTVRAEASGLTYVFDVGEELDSSFLGKDVGASEDVPADEQPGNGVRERERWQTSVGQIKKISGNMVTTFLETDNSFDVIPMQGVLRLHTAGDRYVMERRLAAKMRMMANDSPIRSIVALIEAGASGYAADPWGSHKAVTEQLRRNFKRADDLNLEQREALELAINTPDIALIQGPPGTGKTTVIKAICERFRQIFEAEEKLIRKENPDHVLRSPKILISSFQNEAVDNAISTPLPGDIPAYRKTAKRAMENSEKQYQRSLENWHAELCSAVKGNIADQVAAEFVEKKRMLADEFLSYKNAGEPIEKAAELIGRYLSYAEISYPEQLVSEAKAIILAAKAASSDEDCEDPIIAKIEAQRTVRTAFEDDGARNARRLAAYIRINDNLAIQDHILRAIEAVGEEGFAEEEFGAYVKAVGELKKRFCDNRAVIDIGDREKINTCILTLANTFSRNYVRTLPDLESKKSLILSQFLMRMEQDYEMIVRKYAMTTAATCQTSLDLRQHRKVYDLVIVDEAARANPLDLFIPMSMGRKIILVGDHKQLPHMLEPDVLKMLKDDPMFQDMEEIEKSLFERLFEMFSKGQKKAIRLTRQFRMHPDICQFVSETFYDGFLKTSETVTPEDKKSPAEINDGKPLTFVHVPISQGAETPGASKSRRAEAELISKDVRRILDIDPGASIGVITFYAAQAQLLGHRLDRMLNEEEKLNVESGTVDAFQGKEFDYVLLSCVRSNASKNGAPPTVGFLDKPNRLCVAFSRSIRQLAVYGDKETLKQIPCFSKLYAICKAGGGCYREY